MKRTSRMKVTASLVAIMMLVMSMSMFVSATSTETGNKIIISNQQSSTGVSLKNKVFDVYRVFDVEVIENETEDDSVEYTVNAAFEAFFDQKIDSKATLKVTYTTTSDDDIQNAYDHAAYEYVESFDDPQDLVALLREYVLSDDFKGTITASTGSYSTSGSGTSTIQTVETEAVPDGYYLVVDAEATTDDSGLVPAGALVTVPVRGTDGNLNQDVTIVMKGSQPTINKEVWHDDYENPDATLDNSLIMGTTGSWDTVADYEIGDTVEYRITATVPSDLTGYEAYTYIVTDTLSSGIELDESSIAIYTAADLSASSEVAGANHSQKVTPLEDGATQIVLDIDMLAIKADPTLSLLTTFYIYYSGTVTEDALVATDYENNVVDLTFSNSPYDDTTTTVTDEVFTYTFDLDIFKTKGDGTTALADATFALYESSSEGVLTQVYLQEGDDTNTFYPLATGIASDVSGSEAGVITTDDTGMFTIIGLNDKITYILKEIDAPDGYNAADAITFSIQADYSYGTDSKPSVSLTNSTTGGMSVTDSGLSGKVINTSSALLPTTGGMGTTIFMILGGSMMLGAFVVLVVKRRREF